MFAFQDDELLGKSEVIQHQVLSGIKYSKGDSEPDLEKSEHGGKVISGRILVKPLMALVSQLDRNMANDRGRNVEVGFRAAVFRSAGQ